MKYNVLIGIAVVLAIGGGSEEIMRDLAVRQMGL